jgi:hypothetical protein
MSEKSLYASLPKSLAAAFHLHIVGMEVSIKKKRSLEEYKRLLEVYEKLGYGGSL